jgi:hypothetical protein
MPGCCGGRGSSSSGAGRWRTLKSLGRHLSSWLVARGERVVDVPSTATARVRQLSRGGGRKNDQIDAAAAACVAALHGDGRPLAAEGLTAALALLDESRMNLAQSRVRLVNQLDALLRELLAGGAPRDLSAAAAAELLRRVRPAGDAERVRKRLWINLWERLPGVISGCSPGHRCQARWHRSRNTLRMKTAVLSRSGSLEDLIMKNGRGSHCAASAHQRGSPCPGPALPAPEWPAPGTG